MQRVGPLQLVSIVAWFASGLWLLASKSELSFIAFCAVTVVVACSVAWVAATQRIIGSFDRDETPELFWFRLISILLSGAICLLVLLDFASKAL
jgi:hypothetical protein